MAPCFNYGDRDTAYLVERGFWGTPSEGPALRKDSVAECVFRRHAEWIAVSLLGRETLAGDWEGWQTGSQPRGRSVRKSTILETRRARRLPKGEMSEVPKYAEVSLNTRRLAPHG